ncbi:receptor protein kinase-like protein At4g34220 [Juglans microcarpa x Juglans regia]|uniref:receptor protein kinase-like protein At4g34220 n=1 Tax=Juglans microcarpa x Juglans regia TaxID=2249226 RepID=UPI001B7F340A|nr:receptor protein kinase-like protein At4g34220 [Juglans microcarpa x Juglans regia]
MNLHLIWWRITFFVLLLLIPSFALNSDGILLLSFKYSILSDPLSVLQSWNYYDETPCAWTGVTCTEIGNPATPDLFRVTSLALPNSQLLGSIVADIGMIQYLRHLDLSGNFFNGSLPNSIFNASELQVISLSNNVISGELPAELIGGLRSLQLLNLSENALAGNIPQNLTALQNLTVVSLRSNYFSGSVPNGFNSVEVLDLSSNLLNGSLPVGFGGESLRYLNLSYNKISGKIPPEFSKRIPKNTTIDLSFNNLTGSIPESLALLDQKNEFFSGNADLCGKPLKNQCSIPSTLSTPPNGTSTSSPAIAAIPETIDSIPVTGSPGAPNGTDQNSAQGGLKSGTIAGIAIGDLAGISLLAMVIFYVYHLRKGNNILKPKNAGTETEKKVEVSIKQDTIHRKPVAWSCLGEEASEATSSDGDHDNELEVAISIHPNGDDHQKGQLVTVDGETKLELETLLKASAYILGASGASIVYKAVLEDGTALAVRRIGESGVERMRDFENQVRAIAKLRHPNLVRVRGFYWGDDEKLVIYDFVSNGSLASASYRKAGSSPSHLPLEVRFKLARGVARGLAYIHEKKHVHGNIKPSNILLNSDMEPIIGDFGLERLVLGSTSHKVSSSARFLGSQRPTPGPTRDGIQHDLTNSTGASPYAPAVGSSVGSSVSSPYQAPESLRNLKPNPKWDVYSFGIVLLELLTGRVLSDGELSQWTTGSVADEKNRVLRMADASIRSEVVEGREDAMLACLKLGFSCASFAPHKRPSMKEALQVLERTPCTSC